MAKFFLSHLIKTPKVADILNVSPGLLFLGRAGEADCLAMLQGVPDRSLDLHLHSACEQARAQTSQLSCCTFWIIEKNKKVFISYFKIW